MKDGDVPLVRVEDHEDFSINEENQRYEVTDPLLAEAIRSGVPNIIIVKHTTPRHVRAKIARFLNERREFAWTLQDDDMVEPNATDEKSDTNPNL